MYKSNLSCFPELILGCRKSTVKKWPRQISDNSISNKCFFLNVTSLKNAESSSSDDESAALLRVVASAEDTLKMFCEWKNQIQIEEEFDLAILITRWLVTFLHCLNFLFESEFRKNLKLVDFSLISMLFFTVEKISNYPYL